MVFLFSNHTWLDWNGMHDHLPAALFGHDAHMRILSAMVAHEHGMTGKASSASEHDVTFLKAHVCRHDARLVFLATRQHGGDEAYAHEYKA